VYDYHGKLLCAPRTSAIRASALAPPMLALSNDVLAVLEPVKRTSVHFFSTVNGQEVRHTRSLRLSCFD
jgi:hypothetical protein